MLNDKGIKQAVKKGILAFEPKLREDQIQPASIDLFYEGIDDYEEIKRYPLKRKDFMEDTLQPGYIYDVETTQSIGARKDLWLFMELRSSLRRLGPYIRIPTVMATSGVSSIKYGFKAGFELVNPVENSIKLHKGDKVAQIMCVYEAPSKKELNDDRIYFFKDKSEYRELLELDHGVAINDSSKVHKLSQLGYFSVSKETKFRKGFIQVHAGKEAYVVRKGVDIDFHNKKSLDDVLERVSLPYKLKPGEHIAVDTQEYIDLSDKVGMQFYNLPLPITSNEFFSKRFMVDKDLRMVADGWIDPGYKGAFSRQPKTYYERGVNIKEGDILGYGKLIYFADGVERSYGSNGLGSHYQNSNKIILYPKTEHT